MVYKHSTKEEEWMDELNIVTVHQFGRVQVNDSVLWGISDAQPQVATQHMFFLSCANILLEKLWELYQ